MIKLCLKEQCGLENKVVNFSEEQMDGKNNGGKRNSARNFVFLLAWIQQELTNTTKREYDFDDNDGDVDDIWIMIQQIAQTCQTNCGF